jgi:hypothetical protein
MPVKICKACTVVLRQPVGLGKCRPAPGRCHSDFGSIIYQIKRQWLTVLVGHTNTEQIKASTFGLRRSCPLQPAAIDPLGVIQSWDSEPRARCCIGRKPSPSPAAVSRFQIHMRALNQGEETQATSTYTSCKSSLKLYKVNVNS